MFVLHLFYKQLWFVYTVLTVAESGDKNVQNSNAYP